jgi:hypothetical protein
MMLPPRDDLHFLLFDWLQAGTLAEQPAFGHVDRDSMDAMIDAALDLAEAEFLSHAAKSDANPPTFNDGRVAIIPEVAQALAAYRESGFFGMQPIKQQEVQIITGWQHHSDFLLAVNSIQIGRLPRMACASKRTMRAQSPWYLRCEYADIISPKPASSETAEVPP